MPRKAKKSAVSPIKRAPRLSKSVVPPSNALVVKPAPSSLPLSVSPEEIAREIAIQAKETTLVEKRKQRWSNLPANSKIRAKASQIVALKIEGKDNEEIAQIMGLAPRSLKQYIWIAGKMGWLTSADPQDEVDYRLAHRAVENLDELLHARDAAGMPDKEITLQTLKGVGIFRNHDNRTDGGNQGQQNILQINIQAPPVGPLPQVRVGSMQGAPAFVEGEKIE